MLKAKKDWLNGDFIENVANRGAEIIKVSGKSSAASAAAAACEHMHDWWFGNQLGGMVSMGVIVEKATSYGVDTDLCFSYPVNIDTNGEWSVVNNLNLNDFQKKRIKASEKELLEERKEALNR